MKANVSSRLASEGGSPIREAMLPYGRQQIDDDDIRAVVDVLRSDWLTTGPKVAEYEAAFASRVGAKHAVAVNSGTAALHAAAFAAGLGPGDEAITSPLTFVASANCVKYVGATPVFADVLDDTLSIDPRRIEERITPRTRALIPVDFSGQPAELDEIVRVAARHQLVVIEDAAHALGATYRGRRVGSIAAMTVFSTHPVKHITTGEGGVVTTDDDRLAERLRRFRNHGITSDGHARLASGGWYYEMVDLGYNYRLTDIQCALGLAQLRKLDGWLARREQLVARYMSALQLQPAARLPMLRDDRTSAWHLFVIRIRREALRDGIGRAEVFRALRAENIGVNVHYIPVTWQPYYRSLGHGPGECPVADAAY
ncbi:MAG TPA: UDP-4-amino-4,6-dideoxy-N-acetyl-beta-L-altrosamine transaminase, partial [Vicinamibacterales bacterium]|nr:UDP-4-amino-4,6-dideoxy-N-acetyl-beta-L-altrosamine transaminase [Vicinamibacterales bacterium]